MIGCKLFPLGRWLSPSLCCALELPVKLVHLAKHAVSLRPLQHSVIQLSLYKTPGIHDQQILYQQNVNLACDKL